jgi:hypothetical protein
MSKTCDVYVRLQHGIIIGAIESVNGLAMDSARIALEHGLNENVPRAQIEAWLAQNKQLAAVRRGDVQILDNDRRARDSSRK